MFPKYVVETLKKRQSPLAFTTLILILSLHSSKAQTYIPLLDSPKEWHLTSCFFGCKTDVYYINSDTTVQGQSYKVLDGFHYISRSFLFREELANQKVFLSYPAGSKGNEEVLLYDFALSPGDTFSMNNPISPFPATGGVFTLDSIVPKMLLDGLNHRFYYFSPTPSNPNNLQPVWVEGIGSLSLVNAPGGTPDVLGAGKVSCFFANGNLVYSQLDSVEACVISGLSVPEPLPNSLALYPTIAGDYISIEGATAGQTVNIYNSNGLKVFELMIEDSEANIQQIAVSFLAPGLYHLHLEGKAASSDSFKFIKR